jgi:hypothetical protein
MIPAESLPLAVLIQLIAGKPLADLLEPDLSVLVNLGYGSIDEGWSQGYADVATPFGLFPPLSVLEQVPQALATGLQQGITDAIKDLQNPDTYQPTSLQTIEDIPAISTLLEAAKAAGFTDTAHPSSSELFALVKTVLSQFANYPISDATLTSSPTDLINDLTATVSADYATLLPTADTLTALLTTLPAYDANIFVDQLQAGDLLDAIGDPIAANTALAPFAVAFGAAAPILIAAAGTLVNLADLIPGI